MSYFREELTERLESEGFTYSLIHALGPKTNDRNDTVKIADWKPVIRQRLSDERTERLFQRTER